MSVPTREEIQAEIRAAVQPVLTELKWQRWLLFALVAATFSPNLGGPTVPQITAHILAVWPT